MNVLVVIFILIFQKIKMLFKKFKTKDKYKFKRIIISDFSFNATKCDFYRCSCRNSRGSGVDMDNSICVVCNRYICRGLYLTKYNYSYIYAT